VGGRRCGRGGRDLRLRDVELVLETHHDGPHLAGGRRERCLRNAEVGAQLVEGAERLDPRGVLQYAGATRETGLAAITGAGV
jgi:hypothetical protein